MDAGTISGASIAKRLASCNKSTRDRAVRLLSTWLPQQSSTVASISDGDLIKIWKGLFYCVWHADKLPFQLDLINRLSSLLETIDSSLSLRYFEAFLITIRREWSGIDLLRLDKFYLLIRKFIHHLFLLLKKNDWDLDLLNRLIGVLLDKSLLAVDKFQAQGVNYHIAEVFLDEIKEFLQIALETLNLLLKPFIVVMEKSNDKVLVNKIKMNVFDQLIQNGVKCLNREMGGEVEKFGKIALGLGFSEKFLKSASDTETRQGNREVLFCLHDSFLKLEKDFEKSGLEITFEHLGNVNSPEKPETLVMGATEGDGGSNDRPLKKRKKAKKALDGIEKKSKTKKNKSSNLSTESKGHINDVANGENANGNVIGSVEKKSRTKKNKSSNSAIESNGEINNVTNGEDANGNLMGDDNLLTFDESVISNLQEQFEKVAAEAGMALPATSSNVAVPKKRKRVKSACVNVNRGSTAGKSGEKSVKKVRFSMKNNLVWKPHSPLPPQSLRLPPSATPRGSALKKGIPPDPVKETPPTVKMIKAKGSSVKKGRKSLKSVSSAVKRLRKLQSLSV